MGVLPGLQEGGPGRSCSRPTHVLLERYPVNISRIPSLFVLASTLAVAAAPVAAQKTAGQPASLGVSVAEFQALRWLEGTWRGALPSGGHFYESYTLVDDSTFIVEAFPDSTLTTPRSLGRVMLRGGTLYREEPNGERVSATRMDASGVLFGNLERGFTWARASDGSWTATIHRGGGDAAARRDVVYRIEPYPTEKARDRYAVRWAVVDYVDALYEVEPGRIERSVHRDLAKRGFWRRAPGAAYEELLMSYEELHALAGRWNQRGRVDPESAVKDIVILDLLDRTASAKLTAEWGTDYLHLAKYGDRWQIVHVLWQSPPE